MKLTRLIIALLVIHILVQEKAATDSKSESALQLQKAFELLLQATQGLDVTEPDKIRPNQPIDAGLSVTWFDEQLGQACSISLDRIDEHTSIALFSHSKPDSLKDFNLDTEATQKLALIRHVTNVVGLKKTLVNKIAAENGLSVPAKP
ncbi:MAG: hypothetical protein J0M26_19460 [Planctomycetes bacterium]|nr:hypothetical protein [Planctomycetota bacterium]